MSEVPLYRETGGDRSGEVGEGHGELERRESVLHLPQGGGENLYGTYDVKIFQGVVIFRVPSSGSRVWGAGWRLSTRTSP